MPSDPYEQLSSAEFEERLREAWIAQDNKRVSNMPMVPMGTTDVFESRIPKVRVTLKSGMREGGLYLLAEALRDLAAKDGWELVELAHDEVMISKEIEVTSGNPIMKPCSVEILR